LYGTFPELLGTVTRGRGWLSLADAVHKITGKPAARLGLKERGLLKPGCFADVTIFDPTRVDSRSTYETPDLEPEGIAHVLKDGAIAYGAIG
jgi:dihydroorotase/N-acyl-D-amino-acid deacylase